MFNPFTLLKAASAGKKAGIKIAIGFAVLLFAVIAIKSIQHFIDSNNDAQQKFGASNVQNEALTETIERTEKANEAATNIINDPDAAHRNCVRHSRTPDNC